MQRAMAEQRHTLELRLADTEHAADGAVKQLQSAFAKAQAELKRATHELGGLRASGEEERERETERAARAAASQRERMDRLEGVAGDSEQRAVASSEALASMTAQAAKMARELQESHERMQAAVMVVEEAEAREASVGAQLAGALGKQQELLAQSKEARADADRFRLQVRTGCCRCARKARQCLPPRVRASLRACAQCFRSYTTRSPIDHPALAVATIGCRPCVRSGSSSREPWTYARPCSRRST
jgi:hypothetical protein